METISSPTLSIAQSPVAHEVIGRRSANYHPSIWGDRFLAYGSYAMETDVKLELQFEHMKKRVRDMIVASAEKPWQKLSLIDAIERLGVAYHFEYKIGMTLSDIEEHSYNEVANNEDLYTVALLFRLLRQHGYPVSCDVFNKFKDKEGKFQESIVGNVRGMLSLYEATHLRVHGEEILDEALNFTITHLNSALQKLSHSPIVEQVVHALNQPIHKGLTRLEARCYIRFYEQEDSGDKTLLDFAKLDFNRLQKLHQKELSEITRWWKDLDFAHKLPFARDRVVECYFWIMGVCFEPQYYVARKVLTKVIALATIMDDIYDVYGTLEELVLLTDAIERWENGALDQLPDYMKLFYRAILDVYNMIDDEMDKEGKSYAMDYAKSAMKNLARAYFTEAKWFHGGYAPSFEEYMSNALVSGGYKMMATTSFIGTGELATKEAFDWVSSDPLIVRAASVICRLMDDIVSHKDEQQRGDVPSAVECYIKQYGATEDKALVELQKRIADAWKDMNAECLRPTAVPMPLLLRVLNLTRVIYVLYRDEDSYSNSGTRLKGFITSVLLDSVSIK